MRGAARRRWREVARRRAIASVFAFAALASGAAGAWVGVPLYDNWRTSYGPLSPELRDDPVALFLGFDDAVWERLRTTLGKGDRYAVVARGERRFEIGNYAAYTLLPAIRVPDPDQADVVIYYDTDLPSGCTPLAENVCVVRRAGS